MLQSLDKMVKSKISSPLHSPPQGWTSKFNYKTGGGVLERHQFQVVMFTLKNWCALFWGGLRSLLKSLTRRCPSEHHTRCSIWREGEWFLKQTLLPSKPDSISPNCSSTFTKRTIMTKTAIISSPSRFMMSLSHAVPQPLRNVPPGSLGKAISLHWEIYSEGKKGKLSGVSVAGWETQNTFDLP